MADRPAADWSTGPDIARALLEPLGLTAPLTPLGEGWDNTMYRVASDPPRVLRLPRRHDAVPLLRHEQRWLPELAPHLPLPVPVPLHHGAPTEAFAAPWSLLPWLPGRPADQPEDGCVEVAQALARFLRAVHRPAPADAPHNLGRGIPLIERGKRTWAALESLRDPLGPIVDTLWSTFLDLGRGPRCPHPPVWLHGDPHPGNLLVHDGALAAVIDWGDVCQCDPASDLAVAWMLFDDDVRHAFFTTYGAGCELQARTRGWAIALGAVFAATSSDDPAFHAMARRTLERVARPARGH